MNNSLVGSNTTLLRSNKGASLAIALLATLILSVVTFASTTYIGILKNESHNIKRDFSRTLIKSNLLKTIKSSAAWSYTVANPNNHFIACEKDPSTCLAITSEVPLILHDSDNNIAVNGEQGTHYNLYGEVCNNTSCPLLVKAHWQGVCDSAGTCTQISIHLEFQLRNPDGHVSTNRISVLKNYFIGSSTKSFKIAIASDIGYVAPATKLIVILDSSESMIDNFEKVKAGLTGVLSKLSGHNVKVYFYTTKSLEALTNLYNFYHLTTGTGPSFDPYKGYATAAAYEIEKLGDYHFRAHLAQDMSRLIGLPIEANQDITTITSRLESVLSTFQPTPGSDRESGLCTLHRILSDEGPHKVLEPHDLAFFVVLTDEDDMMFTSSSYSCNKEEVLTPEVLVKPDYVACDTLTESCEAARIDLQFTGLGAYIGYTVKGSNDTYLSYSKYVCYVDKNIPVPPNYSPCPYTSEGTFSCSSRELNLINPDGSKPIQSCYVKVSKMNSGPNSMHLNTHSVNFSSIISRACVGYSFGYTSPDSSGASITYTNIRDFIARVPALSGYQTADILSCRAHTLKAGETAYSTLPKVIEYLRMNGEKTSSVSFSAEEKSKMEDSIIATLRSKFGNNGFALKAFIHDPVKDQGLCTLSDGSYGTAYKNMISKIANSTSSFDSICKSDYNMNFQSLGNTMESRIKNTFVFSIDPSEQIDAIILKRNGIDMTLAPTQYEVIGPKVIFMDGVLLEGDEIQLVLSNTTSSWGS